MELFEKQGDGYPGTEAREGSAQGESGIGAEAAAASGEGEGSPVTRGLALWGWSGEVRRWSLLRKRGWGTGAGGEGEGRAEGGVLRWGV